MTNRDTMARLLAGDQPAATPQWLMAFANIELNQRNTNIIFTDSFNYTKQL